MVYDKFKEDIPNRPALLREVLGQLELPNIDKLMERPAPTMQETLMNLMAMRQNQPPPAGNIPPAQPNLPPVAMPEAGGIQLPQEAILDNEVAGTTSSNPMVDAIKLRMGELGGV